MNNNSMDSHSGTQRLIFQLLMCGVLSLTVLSEVGFDLEGHTPSPNMWFFVVPMLFLLIILFEITIFKDLGRPSEFLASDSTSVSMDPSVLLPAERNNETRFESLPFFRRRTETFPVEKVLQDYYREPIAFALALAELKIQIVAAIRTSNPSAYQSYEQAVSLERQKRDLYGSEISSPRIPGLTLTQIIQYIKTQIIYSLNSSLLGGFFVLVFDQEPERESNLEFSDEWRDQFQSFVKNVNYFCQHTGCEVDDLAPLQGTINNLRRFASDRRQELAPLLEVDARLNKTLATSKRINAALQTRYTIEKLVFELPETEEYENLNGSGPKWQKLWSQIWQDASRNKENPFHQLWIQSTGPYARDIIREKGRNLFADMSGEIHGFDSRDENAFDYQHFDVAAQRVAMTMHQSPIVDKATGDIDWAQEIRRYPVKWPDADNETLTIRRRLKGRVEQLQRQLEAAIVAQEKYEKEAKYKEGMKSAKKTAGRDVAKRREGKKENENVLDGSEEDGLLFSFLEDATIS